MEKIEDSGHLKHRLASSAFCDILSTFHDELIDRDSVTITTIIGFDISCDMLTSLHQFFFSYYSKQGFRSRNSLIRTFS